jgi:aldehyde:ferredoxin oxidoreductase
LRIGERIVNLERLFNVRHGVLAQGDRLPERFLQEPVGEGPAKGKTADLEPMLLDFYRCMGWNQEGIPARNTLRSLDLPNPYPRN